MSSIIQDQNLLNLPEHYHYMEEPRECDFYPGCTYSVILKYEDSAEAIQQDVIIPGKNKRAMSLFKFNLNCQ